jgi:hypothetical protein
MPPRVLIFLLACLSLLAGVSRSAHAKPDPRRDQIEAAQSDALASLVDQVRVARLTPDLTVGDFLQRTGGEERLRKAVSQNVELIGATRWPNPGTCQVQLEVPGDTVVQALASIAHDEAAKSPVPAEVIEKRLAAAWKGRTFAATGVSATPEAVAKMRPGPEHPVWLTVSENDRRDAVQAAQRNAATRTIDELSNVPLTDGKSLSDAMQVPAVRDAVQSWVATRPVTNIEFRDNGEVRLTVAAPGEDLWAVLQDALGKQNVIPAPTDEAGWRRLHDDVVGRLRSPVGGRSAVSTEHRPASRQAVHVDLPQQPPRWADDQLNAVGKAGGGGPRLRIAHAAEGDALKDLRTQIEALPLGDGRKLGDVAAADPEIAAAIDRSLMRARTHKVDWGANGDSVTVRVGLELRHVWQELPRR